MQSDHESHTLSIPTTEKTNTIFYTEKQGQYLAFIYYYTKINRQPPAEIDMQRYFDVTAPSVHRMIMELEKKGLIDREKKKSRSVRVKLDFKQLPLLI